jgi:hypothetical protein
VPGDAATKIAGENSDANEAANDERQALAKACDAEEAAAAKVRKTPSWPRSWANFSLLALYSPRNAWANLHLLG